MKRALTAALATLALGLFTVGPALADSEASTSNGSEASTSNGTEAGTKNSSQASTQNSSQASTSNSSEAAHQAPGPNAVPAIQAATKKLPVPHAQVKTYGTSKKRKTN